MRLEHKIIKHETNKDVAYNVLLCIIENNRLQLFVVF